jgi:hypothetical protein
MTRRGTWNDGRLQGRSTRCRGALAVAEVGLDDEHFSKPYEIRNLYHSR